MDVKKAYVFSGKVSTMANSLEVVMDRILKKKGLKPEKMFGPKINQISKFVSKDFAKELRGFNSIWRYSKHGSPSITNSGEIIFSLDGKKKKISPMDQRNFTRDFTRTLNKLISLSFS